MSQSHTMGKLSLKKEISRRLHPVKKKKKQRKNKEGIKEPRDLQVVIFSSHSMGKLSLKKETIGRLHPVKKKKKKQRKNKEGINEARDLQVELSTNSLEKFSKQENDQRRLGIREREKDGSLCLFFFYRQCRPVFLFNVNNCV